MHLLNISVLILALQACITPGSIKPQDLRAFKSDKCSMFPEGTTEDKNLWCHCCLEHDKSYWQGGTTADRKKADEALGACVRKTGKKDIANLMLAGVRVGGTPYLPTSFRWGYGWPYLRGYKEVSTEEDGAIEQKLYEFENSGKPPVCMAQ